jgi:hypothetical protein
MRDLVQILVILFLFVFVACDKDDEKIEDDSSELVGYWINPVVNDSMITYERVDRLKDDEYGIAFHSNHVFIERKNSGRCGTPPISYSDYKGAWERSESIVNIIVGYWGGTMDYIWEVVSVDNKELTIVRILE